MINSQSNHPHTFIRQHALFDPNQFFGTILLGTISGAVGGLLTGIAARASMRAVALLGGLQPDFSVEGTLTIIGLGVAFGALLGLVYGFILPFLPGSISQKGLAFGGVLSLLIALLILLVEQEGELALVSKWALIDLFASLPLLNGFVMGKVAARLVPNETNIVVENGRIAQTAALIIIVAAIAGAIAEIIYVIAYPVRSTLGADMATLLENVAGGTLLLVTILGIVGLLRSGATGKSVSAKIGLGFALLIFTLLGIGTLSEGLSMIKLHGLVRVMAQLEFDDNFIFLFVLLLIGMAGLLLAGIAVLQARRWQGWHRYMPLLVGLYPFLSLLVLHGSLLPALLSISLPGRAQLAHGVGALFALCWLALGIALRTETESS